LPDAKARAFAVDPAENVVLEASAGTGKTRVLVDRYVNLLRAGVEPRHILAITFTRKAAAEMRQRILDRLRDERGWHDLRDHLGDIAVSTIDAFCLGLLREFPLEADVDPAFELADETEIPRLLEESLDRALRICRSLAKDDDDVALVFAQLGERRLRAGLASLVGRRLVAPNLLRRYLAEGPRDLTPAVVCRTAADRLADLFAASSGGPSMFERTGPTGRAQFAMLARDIVALSAAPPSAARFESRGEQAAFRVLVDRLRAYFMTQSGEARGDRFAGTGFKAVDCESDAAWKRHRDLASALAPGIAGVIAGFRRDLNVILSRGVRRMFQVAVSQYRRTLDARAQLDFSGVLERAVDLLKQMDEFARSRYRLEARYHHVLLDEFQDTNHAQWELVQQLVRSWGEGLGASADALTPSIFIVGDRKQSIYGFRDADVTLLDEATRMVAGLRGHDARRAISVSFRAAPALLAFVNDVFEAVQSEQPAPGGRSDAFRYNEDDRFPLAQALGYRLRASAQATGSGLQASGPRSESEPLEPEARIPEPALGLIAGPSVRASAALVADEIVRLIGAATVRDRVSGMRRAACPADVAILCRSRESHRELEAALEARHVPTYVYKGLGFFDADEIQDAVAALRYLADPSSNLRAAAFLRSRMIRLSDPAVLALSPHLSAALLGGPTGDTAGLLDGDDAAVLTRARTAVARWLPLVDRITPAELLDLVLGESAYYVEIRGPRRLQARENLKKLRALVRRVQNRGYATLSRIADHLEQLAIGDESNAAVDRVDAVSLMTIHAAKGLEFPIVFLVNVNRGTGGVRAPIRITTSSAGLASVAVADFQSEADEEAQARDREDSKRLLYVALTRARDRLYLSATAPEGACRMGRGSLGEALPSTFAALFARAAAGESADGRLTWKEHQFTIRN
jgi:ATP-dependent helicase/nuclease subunit A